jgi:hypothetical protein
LALLWAHLRTHNSQHQRGQYGNSRAIIGFHSGTIQYEWTSNRLRDLKQGCSMPKTAPTQALKSKKLPRKLQEDPIARGVAIMREPIDHAEQ